MDCLQVKKILYEYIDKELDAGVVNQINEHLKECPLCYREVNNEKKFDYLLRKYFPKEEAPFFLKEKIFSEISKGRREKNEFPYLRFSFVAVSVLLVILFASQINRPFSILDKITRVHISLLNEGANMQISSSDSGQIARWLNTYLDFKVMVPDLSEKGVTLRGAKISDFNDVKIASVIYEKDKRLISLFIFEADKISVPKSRNAVIDNHQYHLASKQGYTSVSCTRKGVTCIFISDLDEIDLIHLASATM